MQSRRGFLRSVGVAMLAAAARVYPTPAMPALDAREPRTLIELMREALDRIPRMSDARCTYRIDPVRYKQLLEDYHIEHPDFFTDIPWKPAPPGPHRYTPTVGLPSRS